MKMQTGTESKRMDAAEILKKPYARMITPDADGSFFAEIVEFPGCFASGKNASEALADLESVAVDWINTATAQGQQIPEPMDSSDYSGKLVLRMTKALHKRAALWAQREGVSLNQFIITCLAEAVGERARPVVVYSPPHFQAAASLDIHLAGPVISNPTGYAELLEQSQKITGSATLEMPSINWQSRERQRA
jgi:predicted HicB family RNase H-like nuclease